MCREIVQHHDLAGLECGHQALLDNSHERVFVHGLLKGARRHDA